MKFTHFINAVQIIIIKMYDCRELRYGRKREKGQINSKNKFRIVRVSNN